MKLRLLEGQHGWWAVRGDRAARLHPDAVVAGRLLPSVASELEEHGFFLDPPSTAYPVTVLAATACNLGCAYCFQNSAAPAPGSFSPPRIPESTLSSAGIKNIAAFVEAQQRRYDLASISLLIFGGEPLLNKQGCLELLEAMQPRGLSYAEMVTNAVLLTPALAKSLEEAGLRRLQITFDGDARTHDSIRVTRNGRGTYAQILRNIEAAAPETALEWHFRVNVSHRNLETISDLIADLGERLRGVSVSLHLAFIDDIGIGYDNALAYNDHLATTFKALHRQALALGMSVPLTGGSVADCPFCSLVGGRSGAVINADGDLYSCWETAGRAEWRVGSVTTGYEAASEIEPRWVACDYAARSHEDGTQSARAFFDALDAALLDERLAGART